MAGEAPRSCSRPAPGTPPGSGASSLRGRGRPSCRRWPPSPGCAPTTAPGPSSSPVASSAAATRWRCREARATSSSTCARCCGPPGFRAPTSSPATRSAAWSRGCTPPPTRARSPGSCSIDAQNEDFAAAYKELLTPEEYVSAILNPGQVPGLESYSDVERLDLPVSAAEMRTGAGGHAASPDAVRRPLPLQGPPEPLRVPRRLADRRPRPGVSELAGHAGRAGAGRPPRDRHPQPALHPARPAQAGDPRDPPGGQSGARG